MARQMIGLMVLVLALSCQTLGSQASLNFFEAEAEAALGSHITIVETSETGAALGETFCEVRPVVIQLQPGLGAFLRESVLSHELGHAFLCASGIRIADGLTDQARQSPFVGLLNAFVAEIASCYIDPLADREASKRGFRPGRASDEFARRSERHTAQEVYSAIAANGDLETRYIALNLYCVGLRLHSFSMKDLEKNLTPEAVLKFHEYRHILGEPTCHDGQSCFVLTKGLRDEVGLAGLVVIRNPSTMITE